MTAGQPSVFLAGGTGFVGGAILDHLVSDGREVVALARSDAAAARLAAAGARPVRGDLLDEDALAAGMAGCGTVFHAAGMNAFCLKDPSPLTTVNVGGSVNVVRAAARAGVARVVYTSSGSTIGEEPGTVGREDSPHRGTFISDYEHSKFLAEGAVLAAAAEVGVGVVSVNPASVQGPGRTGGTARLLINYLNGRLRFFVETSLSLVDVDDCARGHLLAETAGVPGERYLLCGACLTTGEALAIVARLGGVTRKVHTLPPRVAVAGAGLVEAVAGVLGRKPPVCREQARGLTHGHRYDGSKATRDLGLDYTPVEETLARTVAWYLQHGYVQPPKTGSS